MWLTVREADKYVRAGNGVVMEAIYSGVLKGYKRDSRTPTVVNSSDLDEWVRSWNVPTRESNRAEYESRIKGKRPAKGSTSQGGK